MSIQRLSLTGLLVMTLLTQSSYAIPTQPHAWPGSGPVSGDAEPHAWRTDAARLLPYLTQENTTVTGDPAGWRNDSINQLPSDGQWAGGFEVPGLNDIAQALVVGPDNTLYVGGEFTAAGGIIVNRIARWDGTQWYPLDSGMDGGDPPQRPFVDALAFGPDGSLYAAGWFETAGGVAASHIARWDGAQWHPLGSGMNGAVAALAFAPDGMLYAGGNFTTAGGVAASYIARWDGARWHPCGSGMGGVVYTLASGPGGWLYAGGNFTTAGGIAANYIARWDGSQWHFLSSGFDNRVRTLATGPDGSLCAGGQFETAGSVAANRIACWDGTTWRALGSGMAGSSYPAPYVGALAFGPGGMLYAGGYFPTAGGVIVNHIARWDGAAWHSLAGGIDGYSLSISALSVGPDGSLYAGGGFAIAGGVAASNAASWNPAAASWHRLAEGHGIAVSGTLYSLASGQDGSLYAGGVFLAAGTTVARHVARWDGTAWHPLGSGVDYAVQAVAVGSDGSLYVGGSFNTAGGVTANGIARWDGTTWRPLGTGLGGYRDDVFALAIGSDGTLYAGGDFTVAGGATANRIARWDGSAWYPLGDGITGCVYDGCVRALAFGPDGSLYAGGWFTMEGNGSANNIARWDGASWHPLGAGLGYAVQALAVGSDGSLYAGGFFTTAGGVSANRVARWDGTAWHTLGAGITGAVGVGGQLNVRSLAFGPDGSLIVAGWFAAAGDTAANSVALWDGIAWHPLGSGIKGGVNALTVTPGGSLYAGGAFSTAGGIPSSGIARWNLGLLRRYLPLFLHH